MTEFTPKNEAIIFDDFDPYLDRYAYENREKDNVLCVSCFQNFAKPFRCI